MREREDVRAVIRQACAPWLWRAADVSPMTDAVLTAIESAGYKLVEAGAVCFGPDQAQETPMPGFNPDDGDLDPLGEAGG